MARHLRRLILWLTAVCVGLVLMALALLWWLLEPQRLRARIEAAATAALGRAVHLEAPLRWQLGSRVAIEAGGGAVAGEPEAGGEPLARWSRISFGVALRPLARREVRIDRLQVDGLVLDLARDGTGAGNWQLPGLAGEGDAAATVRVQLGQLMLRDATLRYRDARSGADWQVTALQFDAALPADLTAPQRTLREVALSLRLAGGPLTAAVPVAFSAPVLHLEGSTVTLPAFTLQWADARVAGDLALAGTAPLALHGGVEASAPSLRALLATAGITPPPMQDPAVLGPFEMRARFALGDDAMTLDALRLRLDETTLTGTVQLPRLAPPALRFQLAADQVALDRYLEPDDVQGEPLTLPLAALRALDARGSIEIAAATLAGAAARRVRIDVE